jgi:molybdopterin converting factor small subunit
MINVTVILSADLRRYRPALRIDESLPLSVPEETTLLELLSEILQIPAHAIAIPIVNGVKCKLNQKLVEGDRVAFWPPMAGG